VTAPQPEKPAGRLAPTIVERACGLLCELALLVMVLLISAEVVARLFHHSFEVVDELGGYLLSAVTFLSLSVALVGGAYHQVEYFHGRLGPRGKALADLTFTLLSLGFALVLEWQLWRLVSRSYASNVTAPTLLGTPLWIPQAVMVLGVAALIFSLARVLIAKLRALSASRVAQEERRYA
jgi:TRAP-type C4-dicarboxylate transport system permease small subunit